MLSLVTSNAHDATSEAVIEPDLPICDPHHHLMEREPFCYLRDDLLADLRSGHHVVATVYVECDTRVRTSGPEHLRPVGEVEYVVQQPVPAGVMAGIVAHADLRRADAVEEVLDAHEQAAEGRLRGIRHSTAWDADERLRFTTTSSPGVMLEPAFQRGAAVLAARGLALDCFLYGHQLDEMVSLAQAVPDLSLVLDHLGTPLVVGAHAARRDEVRDQWRGSMTALAACSNVVVKVGGLGMALMGAPWRGPARPSSDDIAAHWSSDVQWCIDLFGPARCMFESNFPVDRLLVDYVALWNAFKLMSASYSASERGALMHDTAARVYKLSYEDEQ